MASETQPVRVLDVSVEEDLAPFAAFLSERGVPHRIFQEGGRLVVLALPVHADAVRGCYEAWRAGSLELDTAAARARARARAYAHGPMLPRIKRFLLAHRGLAALLSVTLLLFPATWGLDEGNISALLLAMTITPISMVGAEGFVAAPLAETFTTGQLWRLVTPAFLHFGVTHLLFNLAVVTEFGRRIEQVCGTWMFLGLVVGIAVVSNLAQYLTSSGLFGGLSGVAYGLFAYVVVRGRMDPEVEAWRVQQSFVVGVVIFLVLMSSGITNLFGLYIANAAHWAGLILGGLLGWWMGTGARRAGASTPGRGHE